jgi:hypothetical protein
MHDLDKIVGQAVSWLPVGQAASLSGLALA